MSDGSSRDSPEPLGYEIKCERAEGMDIGGLDVEVGGAQVMFGVHRGWAPPPPPRAGGEARDPDQRPAQPRPGGAPGRGRAGRPRDPGGGDQAAGEEDAGLAALSARRSRGRARLRAARCHDDRKAEVGTGAAPDLLHHSYEEGGARPYRAHLSYLGAQDEEPPVLTYEGGPRGPRGATTRTTPPPARTRPPATETPAARTRTPPRTTSPPRPPPAPRWAVTASGVPSPRLLPPRRARPPGPKQGGPGGAPPLPQHPYLALTQVGPQPGGGYRDREDGRTPVGFCKLGEDGWKDCGKKEVAGGRNSRNKRRD
ncbi:hypothetical protein ANANG_G00295480 [Anguilla anguilla]|uniref:Uncharacterized protein n=1 Tax=Anguilla anguilla TaxID=7936 RepID=A0A9D3RJG2_ANGAN|nr:hypothetical protein ANANG_G00295480 [Anguilla anguilla]